jgi:predicted transcriptional regulator
VVLIRYKTKIKRDLIESLEEFPKTTNSLAEDIQVEWKTADNRLKELKEDGVIRKENNKWRLNG